MNIPFIGRSKRRSEEDEPRRHRGYYTLHESQLPDWDDDDDEIAYRSGRPAAEPDYKAWDARLAAFDRRAADAPGHAGAIERAPTKWWQPAHWRDRRKRWWAARIVAGLLLVFFLLIAWLAVTAPLSKSLQPVVPPQITLTATDGTPIARKGADVAAPVKVSELPPHVIEPFLAIEDRRFYEHWGIDPRGIARAAWTGRGGGSTITQQLAKFTFLTPEQTLTRKAREALIAFWLEAWLSKDEILERYLSNAYFGDNTYGLRAASLHYFYRQPEKLRPEQAMMLAGLVQAPSAYAPTRHWDRALARMKQVKGAMVDAGYLTQAQARVLPLPRLDVRNRADVPTGTYFADWALPEARERAGGGYAQQTIETTLDARLQNIARQVIARAPLGRAQAALVAMRPNGEVVAMIGGKDYETTPFNRATQARRQPGSTFKLFVYLTALNQGWSPEDRIDNSQITEGGYRPQNAAGRYSDTIALQDAFAHSSNVAAVRLFEEVGSKAVIATARDLGVTSPIPEGDPSVALGTATMSLLELTGAYAAIAGNAYPVEATPFARQEQGLIEKLWNGPDSFSRRTHEGMQAMLRRAVNQGTGRAAMLPIANYGKTGTTQDHRDALFVGFAGDLVVGVWIGNDDNSPLDRKISGGGLPARIWRDFMRQALTIDARPSPAPSKNPQGAVEPLDEPDPVEDGNSSLDVDEDGVTIRTGPDGMPVDIRIDRSGGVQVRSDAIDEARRQAERAGEEAARQLEQAQRESGAR
ncbi:penicillin-binding protein [Erythrobacter sp. LQ02-29]|uniref:transglycosylase domain-containing protein n=1 Tax=Erythrobacter sp. LQ02-29 TaxID=2920384 RepID=UPI001F4E57F7|nr:transglycosylase domain-containing protein [Erythrobacter sp. LQ02-29]MCP9223773.1 penicillin-binding protein [Erythrobacter sp. LQ02-29]